MACLSCLDFGRELVERFAGYCIALCDVVGKHLEHAHLDLSASSHKG